MAKPKFPKKCRYSHCRHDGVINESDSYVRNGSCFYHTDCREESETIKRIIDLYIEKIDINVVVVKLRAVVNNIIFKRGNSAEFLEFALNYAINNGIKIYNPPGIYYVLQNQKVKKAWEKQKNVKLNAANFDEAVLVESETSFERTVEREDILNKLFGGN